MSHFTTIKTVIRDQSVLEHTLQHLHYRFKTGENLRIRGYQDNQQFGQVVIDTGCQYDIGFQRQTDQSFNVCADWWGVAGNTNIRQDNFLSEINRAYTHLNIKKQVLAQGYLIESEKIMEHGEIELVVCERI